MPETQTDTHAEPSTHKCLKCRTPNATVQSRRLWYCPPCFITSFQNRIRILFGEVRNRMSLAGPPKEELPRALLFVDNSPQSAALAHIIPAHIAPSGPHGGQPSPSRFLSEVVLVSSDNIDDILPLFSNTQFRHIRIDSADAHRLADPSSAEDLHNALLNSRLIALARKEDCSILFTSESCDDLAETTLSALALGQGYNLAERATPVWRPAPNVLHVRPLAHQFRSETETYIALVHPELTLPQRSSKAMQQPASTIPGLLHDFVTTLETDLPASAATVTRTAEKLGRRSDAPQWAPCALCQMPAPPAKQAADWGAHLIVGLPQESDVDPHAHMCFSCLRLAREARPHIDWERLNLDNYILGPDD